MAGQLRLVAEIAGKLRAQANWDGEHSILELRGLGKEIWQGQDAQRYLEEERASWEN